MKIVIAGYQGKMGSMIANLINGTENTQLVAGTIISKDEQKTASASNVKLIHSLDQLKADEFDMVIDFSSPQHTIENAKICQKLHKKMVIGTTGFSEQQLNELEEISGDIAMIIASNTSLGINLCLYLLQNISQSLAQEDVDIEIIETHHRHKVDAPSGTALSMGKSIAKALNIDLEQNAVYAREGVTGKRKKGTIGFQTIRAGDVVGEHTVIFALNGERIEITHKASNREIFAKGAIKAGLWLNHQGSGLYTMADVLGLRV